MKVLWVYDLPNWAFCFLCIGALVLFGLIGLFSSRRFVHSVHRQDNEQNDIVGYFLGAITVFYGILLGLVTISTWNNYTDVEARVDREAQCVGSLYRDVNFFPEPQRDLLLADLRNYLREVIDVGWPQQQRGIVPSGANPILDSMQMHILSMAPSSGTQQILFAETYRAYNALVEARRARLDSVHNSLPGALWLTVVVGALVSISCTHFFHTRGVRMHICMTVLMCGLLGLMIFLIATLDHPFRGHDSVKPESLERVYHLVVTMR